MFNIPANVIRLTATLIVGLLGYSGCFAQDCIRSTVRSPTPFMGNHGEIFKLSDGSVWEVQYSYEYLYEYYPSVVVCPQRAMLMVKDKSIDIRNISGSPTSAGKQRPAVIESAIMSNFEGLNMGNVYRLANGQIWEQVEAWVWVWVWINPKVMIYPDAGGYKMKIENIDHAVMVKQLK